MSYKIGIILFLLVLGGLIWVARPSGSADTASAPEADTKARAEAGPLATEESEFDFGEVSMADGTVSHIFVVTNALNAPVTVRQVYTSCMCTTATLGVGAGKNLGPYGMPGHGFTPRIKETIAPGKEFTVTAIFDPAAHGPAGVGRVERVVTIEYDEGGPLELSFSATVTP